MLVWASCYTNFGEQYGVTLEVKGENIYEEIKEQLAYDDDIADYGTYED